MKEPLEAPVRAVQERVSPPTAGSGACAAVQDAELEHFWRAYWTVGDFDMRGRVVFAIALLIARGQSGEAALERFMKAAVEEGILTLDELMELVLHTSPYAGYPLSRNAFEIAERTFA